MLYSLLHIQKEKKLVKKIMEKPVVNVVELVAEDCAFDQPCFYGLRVESHAVYCHNVFWKEAPRKCRRTWYDNEEKDEDCPGFKPNLEKKDDK